MGQLALSSQNLQDKAAALERIIGNVSGDIVRKVGRANRIRSGRGSKENADIIVVKNSDQHSNELPRREEEVTEHNVTEHNVTEHNVTEDNVTEHNVTEHNVQKIT